MFDHRYIARVVIEADTPLAVGSGESDILSDSLICTDANGLPAIYGSTLTGVLRRQLPQDYPLKEIFGYQEKDNKGNSIGIGSRLIVSNAALLIDDNKVIEGLFDQSSDYIERLRELPVRDHCRIDHRGVANSEQHGKFDRQVVPKGVRMVFELELMGTKEDEKNWKQLLTALANPTLRIGGGTRKGCGKLKIIAEQSQMRVFDLRKPEDLQGYLDKSSSLQASFRGKSLSIENSGNCDWLTYRLEIEPEDFWMFGSGFSDEHADITPVFEQCVKWKKGRPKFTERMILIPATSVKGALSHRIAFHYNKRKEIFADKGVRFAEHTDSANKAVHMLFGCAKDSKRDEKSYGNCQGCIGKVIISDVFVKKGEEKILDHVSLDRFTGGARDGALFNEKVLVKGEPFRLEILVQKDALEDKDIQDSFEEALGDICSGMLPLGGGVMRGHGVFKGKWSLQEEK